MNPIEEVFMALKKSVSTSLEPERALFNPKMGKKEFLSNSHLKLRKLCFLPRRAWKHQNFLVFEQFIIVNLKPIFSSYSCKRARTSLVRYLNNRYLENFCLKKVVANLLILK